MSLVMRARAIRNGERSMAHRLIGAGSPTQPPARSRLDAGDVLERAAFLEFCEGLPRAEADSRALAEAGFPSWEALAVRLTETIEIERNTPHG